MRVYLDLCCLKRPFDLQDQPVVRLQTEAVLSLLADPAAPIELLRSRAMWLENSLNSVQSRREAVALWITEGHLAELDEAELKSRTTVLQGLGFKAFDALHLASSELLGAGVFLTVDLSLLRLAGRVEPKLSVRVTDPVRFIEEISPWKN